MSTRFQNLGAESNPPILVLFVDRTHGRLIARNEEGTERIAEWTFAPDTSSWRPKEGRKPTSTRGAGQSVGRTRGAQRDAFDARMEIHRRRFWQQVASSAAKALRATRAEVLVMGGPAEATRAVAEMLPATAKAKVAGAVAAAAYVTDSALVKKAVPVATKALRARAAGIR
jgi:hypothetical protein